MTFDPTLVPPAVRSLWAARVPPLGPGTPDPAARPVLEGVSGLTPAALAGLWLWFDHLDESHRISQDLDDATGSYWHAMMHRREPDPGNAKYWFRRVGSHPIFPALADAAADLGYQPAGRPWDPFGFVDRVEAARGTGTDEERLCERVQRAEWELLYGWCAGRAAG